MVSTKGERRPVEMSELIDVLKTITEFVEAGGTEYRKAATPARKILNRAETRANLLDEISDAAEEYIAPIAQLHSGPHDWCDAGCIKCLDSRREKYVTLRGLLEELRG